MKFVKFSVAVSLLIFMAVVMTGCSSSDEGNGNTNQGNANAGLGNNVNGYNNHNNCSNNHDGGNVIGNNNGNGNTNGNGNGNGNGGGGFVSPNSNTNKTDMIISLCGLLAERVDYYCTNEPKENWQIKAVSYNDCVGNEPFQQLSAEELENLITDVAAAGDCEAIETAVKSLLQ